MKMKLIEVVPAFFLCILTGAVIAQPSFDKSVFYASVAGTDTNKINEEIKLLDGSSIREKNGYTGALLMRKAGLTRGASHKLKLFRSGHQKLEAAIAKNNDDAELRFLRLMIQENAPGALGYKNEIVKDSEIVKKNYKDLPPVVQHAVADYSKKSKILKPADFNSE